MLPTTTAMAQAIDQREPWERIAKKTMDDCHVESAVYELVRLDEARKLLAPYRARRLKEIRCPICGTFGCGGC